MRVRGYGLVKLLVVLLIIFIVAYTLVPPAIELGRIMFSYASLKDEMRGIARFKAMEEDEDIRKLVVQKAKALGIRLFEEDIIVEKYPGEKIVIDAYYEKDFVMPFYSHRFKFNPIVEEQMK